MVVVPVNAAGKVPDDIVEDGNSKVKAGEVYDNLTTYLWGNVRELMRKDAIKLQNDNELIAQFSSRKYKLTSRGRMQLESKDDMKKRGLSSPDRADATALSCYEKSNIIYSAPGRDSLGKDSYWNRS